MMFPGIPDKEQGAAIHERGRMMVRGKAAAAAYEALIRAGKVPDIIVHDDLSTSFAAANCGGEE